MSREEDAYVIERMGKLLAEIAIIVNGAEPHDTLWSYHDLPEKVRALKQAPPAALAVPRTYTEDEAWREGHGVDWAQGWNECRAAMLAAAERKGMCPDATRCDCIGSCKRGVGGNGAVEAKP